MDKIENLEVKEYLAKFVASKLGQCGVFRKVFGRNFARKMFNRNVKTVYTNEFSNRRSAYRSAKTKSITFCTNQENAPKLTAQEIENSPKLQSTALHESIHAILERKNGTGILEVTKDGKELGRGANEGLTNWLCEKAGLGTVGYRREMNFIKLLELAIGPINVMKMGKGNIKRNISKRLHMSPQETYTFLSLIDGVYHITKQLEATREPQYEAQLNSLVAQIESIIYDKYFRKKVETMKFARNIPDEDYEIYEYLKKLMITNPYDEIPNQTSRSIFKSRLRPKHQEQAEIRFQKGINNNEISHVSIQENDPNR